MNIELGRIVKDEQVDNPNDVNLFIDGEFVCSWEGKNVPKQLYEDDDLYRWVLIFMQKAMFEGEKRGADSLRRVFKDIMKL